MKGYGKAVRDKLKEAGCTFVRHGRGDHDTWYSPITKQPVTVPFKIMSRHMANEISQDCRIAEGVLRLQAWAGHEDC